MADIDHKNRECFPDGTPVGEWFDDGAPIREIPSGRNIFDVTRYGVEAARPDLLQTEKIQRVIDAAAAAGGGVILFPEGEYLSGALFFKPGTALHLASGATVRGSTDIGDFPLLPTRMEGESVNYFAALINADRCDGFTVSGSGTLCGNGNPYWRHFWLRRKFNPLCTNMDEMRPRLLYVSGSCDVHISGITMKDSPFWTGHYYRCRRLKLTGLTITAPYAPVPSPSTDAVDLDNCEDVLICDCFIAVNDDAIALKGGKGPDAGERSDNGPNARVIIRDCRFGHCMSILTCGSETVSNRNIIMRDCRVEYAHSLFFLKMRPDTPQRSEYIRISGIGGYCHSIFYAYSWTQFRRSEKLFPGYGENILLEDLDMRCRYVCDTADQEEYSLKNITVKNSRFTAEGSFSGDGLPPECFTWENVLINGQPPEAPARRR